jgi:mono/diheme cytochrome c family protein
MRALTAKLTRGSIPGLVAACLASTSATACERPASSQSLPEWTPADHHSRDDDQGSAGAAKGAPAPKGSGAIQLVDMAWRQQCTSCHGPGGKGDGPMGPMVRAPDLTREDWQAKIQDAELATVIRNGRNKMPKFDLPEPVVEGLVARIRALRGR